MIIGLSPQNFAEAICLIIALEQAHIKHIKESAIFGASLMRSLLSEDLSSEFMIEEAMELNSCHDVVGWLV